MMGHRAYYRELGSRLNVSRLGSRIVTHYLTSYHPRHDRGHTSAKRRAESVDRIQAVSSGLRIQQTITLSVRYTAVVKPAVASQVSCKQRL